MRLNVGLWCKEILKEKKNLEIKSVKILEMVFLEAWYKSYKKLKEKWNRSSGLCMI